MSFPILHAFQMLVKKPAWQKAFDNPFVACPERMTWVSYESRVVQNPHKQPDNDKAANRPETPVPTAGRRKRARMRQRKPG